MMIPLARAAGVIGVMGGPPLVPLVEAARSPQSCDALSLMRCVAITSRWIWFVPS